MIKSTHTSFPSGGLELRISVEEALASGIKPGDPAVVEATVRPFTVQEYLAEGSARTFETEEEEIEFFGRCPVPGEAAALAAAGAVGTPAVATPVAAVVATPAAPAPESAAPTTAGGAVGDEYPSIRWRSAALTG
jgi:hypothetical protein